VLTTGHPVRRSWMINHLITSRHFSRESLRNCPLCPAQQTAPDRTSFQLGFYRRAELTFYNAGRKLRSPRRSPIRVWLTTDSRCHPSLSTQVLTSVISFPSDCTRQEHKSETYFPALTTFVDSRDNPEWGAALRSKGRGHVVPRFRPRASLADPKICFYPSWLGGIKIHAPDIATWIRRKKKKWCHAVVTEPHGMVAFFCSFQVPKSKLLSCERREHSEVSMGLVD
jgi:hypothetical protein